MERLILADAHVGERRGDAEEMVELVELAVRSGIGELIYLGDAFQYLVGMSKFWTASVRTVLESWGAARGAGVRIALIEGNRDFFLDEPELAPYVDRSGRSFELLLGARRVQVVHGDRLNRADRQYLFWAAVSKSGIARWWAQLLPRSIANRIVRGMEARLSQTNRRFRHRVPDRALTAAARTAFAEGFDLLLWGHFHREWRLEENGRTAIVVPAWSESGAGLVLAEDGTWELRPSLDELRKQLENRSTIARPEQPSP